jgi:hypothetical protein
VNTAQTVAPTDILKFRYIAAYLVEGLQSPAGGPLVLFSDTEQGKKISLTGHAHEGLHHIDTTVTIANLILNAMFQNGILDLGQVGKHLPQATQDRLRRYGANTAYLVVEATHEEEAANIGTIGQSDQRDFCLALPNGYKDKVRERHKQFVGRAQALLSYVVSGVTGLQTVGDCIVADHPSGKPLYVMTFSMSADPTLLKPIPEDSFEGFAEFFTGATESLTLNTTIRRSADSILNRKDNLRAFLFAFTALESFLRDFFKQHKQALLQHRSAGLSPAVEAYVKDMEERREKEGRTKDDYPIAYKFALIASFLRFQKLDQTVDDFGEVTKKHRIAIAHGFDFDEAALPTAQARAWLSELVRLYLDRLPKAA